MVLQAVACGRKSRAFRGSDIAGELPKRHGLRGGETVADLGWRQAGGEEETVLVDRRSVEGVAAGGFEQVLAAELAKLPNKVAIEGHTDSTPYGRPDYSNWELSSDRANAARRILTESGLDDSRISQVRGFADQRLLLKNDPTNPSNRRISIIVRNQGMDSQEELAAGAK